MWGHLFLIDDQFNLSVNCSVGNQKIYLKIEKEELKPGYFDISLALFDQGCTVGSTNFGVFSCDLSCFRALI